MLSNGISFKVGIEKYLVFVRYGISAGRLPHHSNLISFDLQLQSIPIGFRR